MEYRVLVTQYDENIAVLWTIRKPTVVRTTLQLGGGFSATNSTLYGTMLMDKDSVTSFQEVCE